MAELLSGSTTNTPSSIASATFIHDFCPSNLAPMAHLYAD